jgi:hypothetical protein
MPQPKQNADDILQEYARNVRILHEKTVALMRAQHEHTIFLNDIAARIGQARQRMLPSTRCVSPQY